MSGSVLLCKRPPILDSITSHEKAVIEAHAGTGKTYTIEHLVIDLILGKDAYRIEEILIVTFTDKAARELRERIRALIEKVLYRNAETTDNPETPHWRIDTEAEARLKQALFSFELAQISTIHSFCQRILKEAAFFSGGLMSRTLVGTWEIFNSAFSASLREIFAVKPEYRQILSIWLQQGSSLESLNALLANAVVRGVGSLASKANPRLAVSSSPQEIIATLSEIRAILIRRVTSLKAKPFQTIRNRLAAPIIDFSEFPNASRGGDAYEAALLASTVPTDSPSLLRLIAACNEKFNGAMEELFDALDAVRGVGPADLVTELEHAVAQFTTSIPNFQEMILSQFLPPMQEKMAEIKSNQALADFDDLLSDLERALQSPGSELATLLRGRFRVALIDEFQDTDLVQWSIFRRLFFETPAERLYLVGDPKQAIYGFRGADVGTYLLAAEEVVALTGSCRLNLVRLEHNYRSSQLLINGYNLILSEKGNFFRNGAIRYDHPVLCGNPRANLLDGEETVVKRPLQLLHVAPPSGATQWNRKQYERRLHQIVANEILRITGSQPDTKPFQVTHGAEQRHLTFRDIYVLTKGNSEAADVARTFKSMGIPCSLYQTGSIFSTDEALSLASLMGAIIEPHHQGAVSRALLSPLFSLTLHQLDEVWNHPEGATSLNQIMAWHNSLQATPPDRLLRRVFEESSLIPRLLAQSNSERAVTNFLHLIELVERWHAELGSSFEDLHQRLLRAIAEESESEDAEHVQRIESDTSAVRIFTMHKSKGLEAPVVFLCGGLGATSFSGIETVTMNRPEGRITLAFHSSACRFANERAEQTREERERLLYVALTRAGRMLYLPFMHKIAVQTKNGEEPRLDWDVLGVNGDYAPLAERLWQLTRGSGDAEEKRQFATLAEQRDFGAIQNFAEKNHSAPRDEGLPAANIRFKVETTEAIPASISERLATLAQKHAAPRLTSYTKLKQAAENYHSKKRDEPDIPEPFAQKATKSRAPGGAEFGICLHECMEHLDLTFATQNSFGAWMENVTVKALIESRMRSHGIDLAHLSFIAELLHKNLVTPIPFDETLLAIPPLPNLASADFVSREVDFFFPWPEPEHAQILPFRPVDRGLMQGCCDVLFVWQGKHFVLDWKSDTLPDYQTETCHERLREAYHLQAAIYTIALVRMLAIRDEADYLERVGGYLYAFVRGPTTVHGLFSWSDLMAFENRLATANGMRWEERP